MPAIIAFLRLSVPPLRRSSPPLFRAPALMLALAACAGAHAGPASVYLEQMTSPELRERIAAGASTVLVPVGGTEQSGPYIVLGKHNGRAHLLAGRIAERLGNAVVAPTVSYVPEGSIRPPAAHMRYAGTISIPDSAFDAMLDATARSLCQHGLRQVVLLGDHGGYQKNLERVAQHVNKAGDAGCHVYAPPEYYQAASEGFGALLRKRGYSAAEIGAHAGLADVSLSLALDPAQVRSAALAHGPTPGDGVAGDPRRASAELGQLGVQQIIEATVGAIKRLPPAH
ncbi:creatininase family protein [Rugamonas fusca]|nr:creatininase family protein [Rugamonas fusca]